MSELRKICVLTGSRAEYGLLYWLMKEFQLSNDFELQIVVAGMHLSPEFGYTFKEIEQDGFTISKKVELLLSSDSEVGVSKSMGLGMISFADALADLKPDMLVVLGDRFEVFAAVSVATVMKIPVAHLHGGETTEGAFDESFRHSITKMSHLHFAATKAYRNRIIQLGEQPESVFNVGGVGIENINRLDLLSRDELEDAIGFELGEKNIIVTFHPVTLENDTAESQFENLLSVLNERKELRIIFTKSNADTNGRVINRLIDKYVKDHKNNTISFVSLGQLRYLSVMQYMDAVVGNSSSGIIEAPSFKIGTINIGDRQRGRVRADSVIDCEPSIESIRCGFHKLYSDSYLKVLNEVENPYGNGNASKVILNVIRNKNLDVILKKVFYEC